MQLSPREYFTIIRVISDPLDTATYYIRAVIRNARTDAIIDTIDLESKGGNRYSKPWQVPMDVQGNGFYISITTTVYTDSGYSSESPNYALEMNEHLVQTRMNAVMHRGGGSAMNEDLMRDLISEELQKFKIKIPKERKVKINLSPVYSEIEKISDKIDNIPMGSQFDYTFIHDLGKRLDKAIKAIKIPEAKETDLGGVLEAISGLKQAINGLPKPELHLNGKDHLLKLLTENPEEKIVKSRRPFLKKFVDIKKSKRPFLHEVS